MHDLVYAQGRELTPDDIAFIRQLINAHPHWSRRALSIALSEAWNWRNAKGVLKDMACRSMLLKLHERDYIQLPARRQSPTNRMVNSRIRAVAHDTTPINASLNALAPLRCINVYHEKHYEPLYHYLLARYHYLGYSSPVGENLKYLVVDRLGRALACVLFGSSAWSCVSRDAYVGWDSATRQRNLSLTTNNMRFLILPWVKIAHLASHVLGRVTRRVSKDWQIRYGHPVYLLETFVDRTRFTGTCYRAANWCYVGDTRGRSRNDRYTRVNVACKSVFVYPLVPDCQLRLQT